MANPPPSVQVPALTPPPPLSIDSTDKDSAPASSPPHSSSIGGDVPGAVIDNADTKSQSTRGDHQLRFGVIVALIASTTLLVAFALGANHSPSTVFIIVPSAWA